MDILIKHWLPILGLLLPSVVSAIVFAIMKRKKSHESLVRRAILGGLTVIALLSSVALAAFVLSVGGGIELILAFMLLPLFITLI